MQNATIMINKSSIWFLCHKTPQSDRHHKRSCSSQSLG